MRLGLGETGMARLTGGAPVLLVADLVAAAAYWERCVGFRVRLHGEPPDFAVMARDAASLMLARAPSGHEIVPHWRVVDGIWDVYFDVDDADALHAELVERGARIDYGLGDKPYGMREFGIQDLDGHDIGFGSPLPG